MSVMTAGNPAHRKKAAGKGEGTVAAWAVLLGMGGTTVTYNIFHAVHHGPMPKSLTLGLALLYGIAPVFAAMCLSHLVAVRKGDKVMQRLAFAVMLGAMALSIGAVGAVVKPVAGPYFCWVFGAVLDAAALLALRMILGGYQRKADEATALEIAETAAADACREAGTARQEAADVAGKASALETELAAVRAALEAERARRVPPRKQRRGSGRKAPGTGTRNRAPVPPGTTAPEPVPDIDAEIRTDLRIMELVAEGHSASEAGILAGASDSYGRQVVRMAKAARTEPAGDERTDGDMATGEQPRVQ
jgi:hypothetical protein